MSLVIQNPNASFNAAIGLQPRVSSGMIAAGLMGSSIGRNLYGSATVSVKGNPTKVAGYDFVSTLDQSNYIDTNIDDSIDMTIMLIAKVAIPTTGPLHQQLIGTYQNYKGSFSSYVGTAIILEPGSFALGAIGRINQAGDTIGNKNITGVIGLPSGTQNALWKILALRVAKNEPGNTGGFGGVLQNLTDNVQVTTNTFGTDTRLTGLGNTLKVGATNNMASEGGTPGSIATQPFDCMGFAVYNRCLTNTELQTMYSQFKGIAAGQGITV